MANMIANIPITVSSCAENLRIESANTSLRVFVSAPILVSRSPDRAWLAQARQQVDRLGLPLLDRVGLRMTSPVERERVDLPDERDLLVPRDPLRQARIVGGGAPVGIEDRGPRSGEVRQLARLAQGE